MTPPEMPRELPERSNYRTYLYAISPINGSFELPEIDGRKCVGMNAGDLFGENLILEARAESLDGLLRRAIAHIDVNLVADEETWVWLKDAKQALGESGVGPEAR